MEKNKFSVELQHAAELYARGDFEGSRAANQHIIAMSKGRPPEDQALFNMGLLYASNKNPKKDYRKSIAFFQRVIKEHPQSLLTAQARTWVGVLEVIEKSKDVDIEMEKKKKRLMR